MNPIQTGIAVALALAVVTSFFIFPGLSPFSRPQPSTPTQDAMASTTITQATTTTTTMPPKEVTQLEGKDEVVGTGATAAAGDTVTVNYVGSLTDGTVFDASAKHGSSGFTFKLGAGQVIKGWDMGVAGMKEGGKRMLVIPADMAYGANGIPGVIPGGATLVFEVELMKVQK